MARSLLITYAAIASVILVQFSFSGYHIVTKKALSTGGHSNEYVFGFLRDGLTCPFVWLLALIDQRGKVALPKGWRDWLSVLVLGISGIFGNQILFIVGTKLSTADLAAIMQPLIPVFTTIIGLALGMETLPLCKLSGWAKGFGIFFAVLGAGVMIGMDAFAGISKDTAIAYVCFVGNTLGTSIYVIVQKPLLSRYPLTSLVALGYTVGAVCMGLLCAGLGNTKEDWDIQPKMWYAVSYASIVVSGIGWVMLGWSNKHLTPSLVTAFFPLQVLGTVLLSTIFLDAKPRLQEYLGGALIILGLFSVTLARHSEENWERNPQEPGYEALPADEEAAREASKLRESNVEH